MNKIYHEIRIKCNNLFIFAKAFPLIEVKSEKGHHDFNVVGGFTRYPSEFRFQIYKSVEALGKVVNLKFDILKK